MGADEFGNLFQARRRFVLDVGAVEIDPLGRLTLSVYCGGGSRDREGQALPTDGGARHPGGGRPQIEIDDPELDVQHPAGHVLANGGDGHCKDGECRGEEAPHGLLPHGPAIGTPSIGSKSGTMTVTFRTSGGGAG